ncbi:NB-ARC domain-containing protein [Jeotgalibacillus haloalkalitolerans]|uniref:NB-ARC domain-containing protein n=1 Tax=Jeotgalibacillus haloalkalitolerans TaxID=3104292 RepID=A0ABU5KMX5_9BACL|nr:NB-ARC domain-containing protein [Jeotgalibacillus sp. HH7-29]MDZ5712613.1 NB-ARC domain-containing protein [Jeotgalibacillus sp. HH7-29]
MSFLPIDRMWLRAENGREESNVTYFNDLMYTGEMVCKIITLGIVASISDSRDNHRYRHCYELVRADGLGSWAKVVNDSIVGPSAQYIYEDAREELRELTEKKQDTWQSEAVKSIHNCLKVVDPHCEDLPHKVDSRKWLDLFSRLRNKTRGHGATTGEMCNAIVDPLEKSIKLVTDNFSLFKKPWAFLHRNLSGKYRVSKISSNADSFNYLKSTNIHNYPNGIYIFLDGHPRRVDLFETTVDLNDFHIANGGFTEKKFELLSYITGSTINLDSRSYLLPVSELPRSETQSLKELDIVGSSFTNMPFLGDGYIKRAELEDELLSLLKNDRHPIITLLGRGGIGKTSLSLNVLQTLAKENEERFKLIIWISARDIDLLEEGPKQVAPDITTLKEIVKEYWGLVDKLVLKEKNEKQIDLFSKELNECQEYGPTLFIFDNFETVSNPVEMFNFIDTYIRNPNKVLITTRHREFKGDYPIEVFGMNKSECDELAESTANRLGITELLNKNFYEELYQESEGHPYVVKIILGERSKSSKVKAFDRIITNRDDILNALFERTYLLLSDDAKRVFFTLCNWKSIVPQLALEAVMLRSSSSGIKIKTTEAIDELSRISFIEVFTSEQDGQIFLSVPLAAAIFGKRKLAISHFKNFVEADTILLQFFGAAQKHEIKNGIEPRVNRLFRNLARNIKSEHTTLEENLPMLEFIARHYYKAWILIANLSEEFSKEDPLGKSRLYLEHYLEYSDDESASIVIWDKIASIDQQNENWSGYIHALVEKCLIPSVSFKDISEAANKINHLKSQDLTGFDIEEQHVLLSKLADKMKERIKEADATDCSRLCWILMSLDLLEDANKYLELGLDKDPNNDYCKRLKNRLQLTNG